MSVMWQKLRKFSLQYCDLPTMLSNLSVPLRVLTINIDSNRKGLSVYYLITIVAGSCNLYACLISMLWFMLCRCSNTEDMLLAMTVIALCDVGNVKLGFMYFYRNKYKKIVAEYLKYDSQIIPGRRFHNNLLAASRIVKKRAIVIWIMVMGNGFIYLLSPFFASGRHFPDDSLILFGLEPMFESPNYEIAWTVIAIAVAFISFVPATVSAFCIVISGYAEAQMLALSTELINIWPDAVKQVQEAKKLQEFDHFETHNNLLLNKCVKEILKDLIARHAFIKTTFQQIEEALKGAIVTSFLLLVIALIIALLGNSYNSFMHITFAFQPLAMDCFIGQRVIDASNIFEQAVYNCGWENFDTSNRKMVLIMLQNSQKTMMLSAGGIATLSYFCLMTIIKGIYSTYTTLRSTVR